MMKQEYFKKSTGMKEPFEWEEPSHVELPLNQKIIIYY